jgi:hypothetical protein
MMSIYDADRRASSAPLRQQRPKRRRRISVEAWAGSRTKIDNEHKRLESIDPNSPRVRPSLGVVGWILP